MVLKNGAIFARVLSIDSDRAVFLSLFVTARYLDLVAAHVAETVTGRCDLDEGSARKLFRLHRNELGTLKLFALALFTLPLR
jgi:hypothetical protein